MNDLNWHHVAVVGDGKSVRFYVDGVASGYNTTITSFSMGPSANDVLIGATRNAAPGVVLPMHGAIDELHIFDKALSDSEIRLLAAGASTEDYRPGAETGGPVVPVCLPGAACGVE
ncbi:LamG domain-containing protein [Dawidia soli]|uniref:LamG domain-containing protein n=1 Tax=Dawidia soli TaxID=2782352 RepID=UPI00374296C2